MRGDFARCPAHPEAARFSGELGLWLIGRHDEVRAVMADRTGFGPENALHAITPIGRRARRALAAARFALPPTLASNGGATHRAFRAWTARWFAADRVEAARPRVEALARAGARTARGVLDTGEACDLVPPLCRPVAATVLLDMLGVTDVCLDRLHRWSADSLELFWGRPDADRQAELALSAGEFHQWIRERVVAARAGGGDDFIAALTRLDLPEDGGRPVTDEEAISVCYFLLIAGQATTAQLAAAALRLLIGDRVVWDALVASPDLVPRAVEEALRLVPSVTTWRRVAREDREIGGRRIRAGEGVLLGLADAGRDPEVFDEPSRVRLDRPRPRAHLAFGAGAHRCLGAELARMEVTAVIRAASELLPDARVAGEAEVPMLELLSFRAPHEVWVRAA